MSKLKTLLAILLVGCALGLAPRAHAQEIRYNAVALTNTGWPAPATIAVCTSSADTSVYPCASLATIYTDETGATQAENPFPTDGIGNYGFWAPPGHYKVQVYGTNLYSHTYDVFLPCDPNGAACGTSTNSTTPSFNQLPLNTFQNDTSKQTSTVDNQALGTCSVASLAQGDTSQCPFIKQFAGTFLRGPIPIGSSGAQVVQVNICRGMTGGTDCRLTGPLTAGDTFLAFSSVHTGSWATTDALGNPVTTSSGANGLYWTSVATGTGDSPGCAATGTCDGINIATTWTDFTMVVEELAGPTSVDTAGGGTYSGSGPDMTATGSVTTAGTHDFLVADAWWSADLCGDVNQFAVTSSPSYTNAYLYPVTGSAGPYAGYLAISEGDAATAGSYSTTQTGVASGSGCGASEILNVIAYKTSGVATDVATPVWGGLNCLDLYQIDPNLALTCNTGSTTNYLTGVTLTAPSLFSVSGSGTSALGLSYSTGLTGSENYVLGVNASGAAGLYTPLTFGIPVISGTPTAGNCADWASASTLGDSGSPCGGGGGSLPTSENNQVLGGPISDYNTATSVKPLTPCKGAGSISSCDLGAVTVGEQMIVFYETGNESSNAGGCTLSSSLGNTWTQLANSVDGQESAQTYYASITVAGDEVVTPSGSSCTSPGQQVLQPAELFNTSGVDVKTEDIDAPTNSISITGTYADEAYLLWSSNAVEGAQRSNFTQGTQVIASRGNPPYSLSIAGEANQGTYTFNVGWSSSGSYGRAVVVGLIPSPAVAHSNECVSTAQGVSVTTCTITDTAGELLASYISGPATTGCNATDSQGNTWTASSPFYYNDVMLTATATASGTDTITYNSSCAIGSSNYQWAVVAAIDGKVTYGGYDSGSSPAAGTISTREPGDLILTAVGSVAGAASTSSVTGTGLHVISASTTVPKYIFGYTQPSEVGSYPFFYGGSYANAGGWFLFTGPSPYASVTPYMRHVSSQDLKIKSTTVCAPRYTYGTTAGQWYYHFDGTDCGIFQTNLTGNISRIGFNGFQDGQSYTFEFVQDATGGHTLTCGLTTSGTATVTSLNYCPAINLASNATTVLHATFNSLLHELVFSIPGTLYNTTHAAGTASISATTMATAPATLYGNEYRALFQVTVTAVGAACTGPTTVAVNLIWQDTNGSATQTVTLGTASISSNSDLGTIGDTFSYSMPLFQSAASKAIQFSTTYTAGTGCTTDPTVQVTPILEQVR